MSKPQPPASVASLPPLNATTEPQKVRPLAAFRRARDGSDEPEITVGLPPMRAAVPDGEPRSAKAADLGGRPPVWFLIGPNYSGKTTFARWAADRMFAAGRSAFLGALDPLNRTLADFFVDVEQPSSADPSLTPAGAAPNSTGQAAPL